MWSRDYSLKSIRNPSLRGRRADSLAARLPYCPSPFAAAS
jgi:hypothetical protein